MSKVNKTLLSVGLVFAIVLTTIGVSYSYFSSNFNDNLPTEKITMTNGTMTLGFSNGSSIGLTNIYPSDEAVGSKQFSITGNNTTNLLMHYRIKLIVTKNEFPDDHLRYSLVGNKSVAGGELSDKVQTNPIPVDYISLDSGIKDYDLGTGYFSANADGESHQYILNIYYPETNTNQSEGIGKSFSAYVTVVGVEEINN